METHEEYYALIKERYESESKKGYEQAGYFATVLYAPWQYKVEISMLNYTKQHPNASLKEMYSYFNKITPIGLAPGDDGADLLED